MFRWILLIIAAVVVLRYVYLMMKRWTLIQKINKIAKKNNGSVQYCRNPFVSVFKHDGKTDFTISLELIVERRAVYVVNHKVANGFSSMDRVYTIWKYKMDFQTDGEQNQKYVILNPAPRSISRAEGSKLEAIGNNDTLIDGIKICGLKWFVENIAM